MTKTQKLRNTAEGLMAGLVATGFEGPFTWAHHQWEGAFYRAWNRWEPRKRDAGRFPSLEVGGHGRSAQAREVLWQLKRTSPFCNYATEKLPTEPRGLPPLKYLDIWAEGATPDEWVALAEDFLAELSKYNDPI